ncbi:VWA domain-containing protein [Granulicella sp. 5B5]|uniref:VWA domain-containing protein n=1 Tax=Granulicella sp. 5B5 TaxID=1617967 RepID=UPI0021039686|nr:VWA domain-containing protein [Granulicella sp. 5B5]
MLKHGILPLTMALSLSVCAWSQTPTPQTPAQTPTQTTSPDDAGPQGTGLGLDLPKKKEEAPPPPAPAEDKTANPGGTPYSLRVDVPIVNLDVSVLLDKNHQFVPGLKENNFLVVEDGVEQQVTSVRTTKVPITAVMLLEFASTSWPFLQDMENASASFFRTLQPDDYIAVETYDMRTHILCDFTNNKDVIREALQSMVIPGFSETNEFDALYETLDRLSRVEGRKYIILVSSGRDTMSRLTLDKMLAKIKATPDVTIFTISTGGFVRELRGDNGLRGISYLQADNEMQTFANMTGGMHFKPVFQGELPDIFGQINESIRNQYVLTYRPTNKANDGSYRKVKVYLVDNEGKPLRMQDEKGKPVKYSIVARDGYRAKLPVE